METEMTIELPDWLGRQAAARPDAIALESAGQQITYAALHRLATQIAGGLRALGVQRGERVAVLTRSSLVYAQVVHGLMQAEAVLVPLNVRLTLSEIQWQLMDADVRWLLHDDAESERAAQLSEACSGLRTVNVEQSEWCAEPVMRSRIRLDEVHAVIYTSGTTGRPKGALITYGNHWWSATASALHLGLSVNERWLAPMPLFHVGGLSIVMRSLIYGTTAVLHDRFDAAAVNRALDEGGITIVSVVPVMLQRMLATRTGPYPPVLRCVLLGGSGAPRALLDTCRKLGVPVAPTYGLTEANSQVTTLRPHELADKPGSSGRPLFVTEVAIRVDGRDVPPGVAGEIVVRGPTLTPGYLGRPDATQEALRDGWLHTGDIGYLDDEGYLYVLDRRRDLIVSGGENVYPAEVEGVLTSLPGVAEAAVVGADDPDWGQVPVAFVVTDGTAQLTAESVARYCREHLAAYKVPRRIEFVPELPRNASGKLLRGKLREWLNTAPLQNG